jgi:hypothetical protein
MAAIVIVAWTKSEEKSLTVRARNCARMMTEPPDRAARRIPGDDIDPGVDSAQHSRKRKPERRAQRSLSLDDLHNAKGDPDRPSEHADRDREACHLLQLAGPELEAPQNSAMDPPHDDKREYFDRQHQPRANRLGHHGERAADETDLHHGNDDRRVGHDGQEYGPLFGLLVGRDHELR